MKPDLHATMVTDVADKAKALLNLYYGKDPRDDGHEVEWKIDDADTYGRIACFTVTAFVYRATYIAKITYEAFDDDPSTFIVRRMEIAEDLGE